VPQQTHGTGNRKTRRSKRVGLSADDAKTARSRLRGSDDLGRRLQPYIYPRDHRGRRLPGPPEPRTFVASAYWLDQHFRTFVDRAPDGSEIEYVFADPSASPAGQVRCRQCGHRSPPQLVTGSGHCSDCAAFALERVIDRLRAA
jgi:hypothetical protein